MEIPCNPYAKDNEDLSSKELVEKVYEDKLQTDDTILEMNEEELKWRNRWEMVIAIPSRRYIAPKGQAGKRFVGILMKELEGVRLGKWNSERVIVFQAVMMQHSRDMRKAWHIRRRLNSRMDLWIKKQYDCLVESTMSDSEGFRSNLKDRFDKEHTAKVFQRLLLQGRTRASVRWATERDNNAVLDPWSQSNPNSDELVIDILNKKHPSGVTPPKESLFSYEKLPLMNKLDIYPETVKEVAHKMGGSGGPGGSDGKSLRKWLLHFGVTRKDLQKEVGLLIQRLANENVRWETIRGFMADRLIALNKSPGVRPIGIGECWRRLFAKVILKETGGDATEACGVSQLCCGLECGIEGAIKAAVELVDEYGKEESWCYLLVDAKNAFNEINRVQMLWTIRHLLPRAARFVYNCYKGMADLVVRGEKTVEFLKSREGVTQGDPLAMVCFGLTTVPILKSINENYLEPPPSICYADDVGVGGKKIIVDRYFDFLTSYSENYGYFPQKHKSLVITSDPKAYEGSEYEIAEGGKYLGGFLGKESLKVEFIENKIRKWIKCIDTLADIAAYYPQSVFTSFTRSLQHEFNFVHRTVEVERLVHPTGECDRTEINSVSV